MRVLYLSPAFPPEMAGFCRGLAAVGAEVWGVGDSPATSLPDDVRRSLSRYLQVPSMLDEEDVHRRVLIALGPWRPDRVETNWEPVILLAARLRETLGVPGLHVAQTLPFRDKELMKERAIAAGLPCLQAVRARTAAEVWEHASSMGYPIILKPVAGAGSADTLRVEGPEELTAALARIGHLSEVLIEPFVVGDEHTFETVCVDGKPMFFSVSTYEPNTLVARQNEWISPIIFCRRHLQVPELEDGIALGVGALSALGMGTGFTHFEWFRTPTGRVYFGEMACRAPGANMVDLMNYANDIDLYVEWARCIVHGRFEAPVTRPYASAIVFKRAIGQGRIRRVEGLDTFLNRYGQWVARVDLLPIGATRRDWRATFLSDGNLVVRHPEESICWALAREAASSIRLIAE
jgi:formate-dependent phosphoribosylglycinamide formyltransferase (GAR transformylase)